MIAVVFMPFLTIVMMIVVRLMLERKMAEKWEPDASDKQEDETWTKYWARKRRERHGEGCPCRPCRLDSKEK